MILLWLRNKEVERALPRQTYRDRSHILSTVLHRKPQAFGFSPQTSSTTFRHHLMTQLVVTDPSSIGFGTYLSQRCGQEMHLKLTRTSFWRRRRVPRSYLHSSLLCIHLSRMESCCRSFFTYSISSNDGTNLGLFSGILAYGLSKVQGRCKFFLRHC